MTRQIKTYITFSSMGILKNTGLGKKYEYFNADCLRTSVLDLMMNRTVRKKISVYSVIKKDKDRRHLSSGTRTTRSQAERTTITNCKDN